MSEPEEIMDEFLNYEYDHEINNDDLEIISNLNVLKRMKEKIKDVSELIFMNQENTFQLLQLYNWDFDKLKRNILFIDDENKLQKLQQSLIEQGVLNFDFDIQMKKQETKSICSICQSNEQLLSLNCNHAFCQQCWDLFLVEQITNIIPILHCLKDKCQLRVPLTYLEKQPIYEQAIIKSFIFFDKTLAWCPGLNCVILYKSNIPSQQVYCQCGSIFCFYCRDDIHTPVPCDLIQKWKRLDRSNDQWLLENTKECPKCQRTIQKTDGCNHIKCLCNNHFCYVCGDYWDKNHTNFYKCPNENLPTQANHYQKHLQMFKQCFIDFNFVCKEHKQQKIISNQQQIVQNLLDDMKWVINSQRWSIVYCYFLQKFDYEYLYDLINECRELIEIFLLEYQSLKNREDYTKIDYIKGITKIVQMKIKGINDLIQHGCQFI